MQLWLDAVNIMEKVDSWKSSVKRVVLCYDTIKKSRLSVSIAGGSRKGDRYAENS